MLTCAEYLELFPEQVPKEIYVHGLDLLQHVLHGNIKNTWHKDNSPYQKALLDLQTELEKPPTEDDLNRIIEDNLRATTKWQTYDEVDGELSVERFIQYKASSYQDDDILMFDGCRKEQCNKPAITILMDMDILWHERNRKDMETRHKKVYSMVVQAMSEGRPCRVVAVFGASIVEKPKNVILFITIKDFNDPIFSGIWGAFKCNRSTNDFCNTIMDYFIGTATYGNGSAVDVRAIDYFEEEEYTIVNGRRLS